MQVLSDLIPITNGEVFSIIRRNREQRNIKALPHYHAQSIGSITGSSAHQALAMQSRFAHRDAMAAKAAAASKEGQLILIQPSVLSSGASQQPHNTAPHTEIKVLHYLQKERDFYGPSSIVMRRFEVNADYNDSSDEEGNENDNTAAAGSSSTTATSDNKSIKDPKILQIVNTTQLKAPTPLAAVAQAHHDKILQGLAPEGSSAFPEGTAAATAPPPSDPAVPSLFYHESTSDNVVALEHCLTALREHGQQKTRDLLSAMKQQCFVGNAVVKMLVAAWEEQTAADKAAYLKYASDPFAGTPNAPAASSSSSYTVDQSTIERGVAKRLHNALDGASAAINTIAAATMLLGLSPQQAAQLFAPKTSAADASILATNGLPISPLVLRNLIDLRHSLTSEAHVAAVIPLEMAYMGDLAEFVLRHEVVRAAEERLFAATGGAAGAAAAASTDAFAAAAVASKASLVGGFSFQNGVEDAGLALPQAVVEGFRYSAVMGICTTILNVLKEYK